MHFYSSRFRSLWLVLVALILGIWSGRSLRTTQAKPLEQQTPLTQAIRSRTGTKGSETESGSAGEKIISLHPKEFFVVPPEAFHKIRVALLAGTSLDYEEARVLGLSPAQIQKLEHLVREAVKRLARK